MALLYYRLVLKLSEEQVTGVILPIFTLFIILSIPLWIYLSKIWQTSPSLDRSLSAWDDGFYRLPHLTRGATLSDFDHRYTWWNIRWSSVSCRINDH